MLSTVTTLTIPAAALTAAEKLREAQQALNAADGQYAWGEDAAPYGMTEDALLRTLGGFLGGDMSDDRTATFARFVLDCCIDNGDSIMWQITAVLGWTIVTTAESNDYYGKALSYEAKTDAKYRAGRVPVLLGGEDITPYPLGNSRVLADAAALRPSR